MTQPQTNASFFDYQCDLCAAPVCERMTLINLALGYEETTYCLSCLAQEEGLEAGSLMKSTKAYIQSRDCFKKPWNKTDASQCPLLAKQLCFCQ